MAFSLGILAGITALFGWGGADFLSKFSIDKIGAFRTLFWMQVIGFLAMLPLLAVIPISLPSTPQEFGLLAVIAVLNIIAYLALYRGFKVGLLSIVSPISSSETIITILLSLWILGEQLAQMQGIGVALVIFGVIITSINPEELKKSRRPLSRGVPEALCSAVGWGVMWFLIAVIAKESGAWLSTILEMRLLAIIFMAAYALCAGKPLLPGEKKSAGAWKFLFAVGILDALAFLAVAFGFTAELVSVVTPISNAYISLIVILSLLILKERPAPSQLVGVLGILAGVLALSV